MASDKEFIATVWRHYDLNARDMPWRRSETDGSYDPYKILVSEMMLQQTQVSRVIPKFNMFITRFPDMNALANAPLSDVIRLWSGLGYNRRAKYLHDAARTLADKEFPTSIKALTTLKGIGFNTAAAILTYSNNIAIPFIETNIRTVYVNHYFPTGKVSDSEMLPIVQRTIDTDRPREWMWALMDYGSELKRQGKGNLDSSTHYKKQAIFRGSVRQLRGEVLRQAQGNPTTQKLRTQVNDTRIDQVLRALIDEGLIIIRDGHIMLP